MHQDAFITALEFVCNADDDRSIEGITNALAFWLQLSDETTKLVKLTFGLFNGPLRPNLVDRTLERLLANSTFDGCKLQKATGRRSLLLWRNAQVKFAIVNGHTDPLFDIW
uniref:Uncharacterized protein n=1 Tax=Plectus sambesii TaxID=2011161 RepID=A0A914UX27_9BILA